MDKETENKVEHKKNVKLPRFGMRHQQVICLFLLVVSAISMRVQLSVVIVAMLDPNASSNPDIRTFDWNNKNVVLSSFFWGYITLQLFAADWARTYGAKPFLLVAMTINATAVALVPILADKFQSYGVMASRVIQGMCQGFVFPSVSTLLGRWCHISERSRLGSWCLSGAAFGTIISLFTNGLIASSQLGWPFCFYIYGAIGYLWVLLFLFLGSSSPAQCSRISKEEKEYIESSTKIKVNKIQVPWKSILTTRPVWILMFAQVGQIWGYNTLITEIPNYMKAVMLFDMKSNGALSSAPYIASFFCNFGFGFLADYLINHKYLTRTATRKLFNSISGIGAGTSLLILSFLPASARIPSVFMLVSAVGIQSAATGGYNLNHIDLSPNFSGTLQAMCNSVGSALSSFAPILVQLIVTDDGNKSQWQIVFIVAAMAYIIPSIAFAMFASGKRQKWDGSKEVDEKTLSEVIARKASVWSVMSV
ncbi:putative inorganic phosphate cotransporter [Diorhabda carinulata]|uniref:putative inorganic phosphate cotransporter n=1 Tax=Diorhabda carinulata TaxID=1163345 RepID=UPI0025A30FF8|nr:putative inorganic phosphate cotransporter [Diorhabda carinulata]